MLVTGNCEDDRGIWELSDFLLNYSIKLELLLKCSLFKNMCMRSMYSF